MQYNLATSVQHVTSYVSIYPEALSPRSKCSGAIKNDQLVGQLHLSLNLPPTAVSGGQSIRPFERASWPEVILRSMKQMFKPNIHGRTSIHSH